MLDSTLERRAIADVTLAGRQIVGYAIVFDTVSEDLGGFREVIAPEAVDRTLRDGLDVRALVNHAEDKVLGRTKAGTLRLAKDARGLRVEIDPPDTTVGRDVVALVSRGDITGMSFSFHVVRPHGERFERRDGQAIRIVTDMVMKDVSIVTFPAYTATDVLVAQRSLEEFQARRKGRSIDWLRRWATAG
jgi:uncharacterized protein